MKEFNEDYELMSHSLQVSNQRLYLLNPTYAKQMKEEKKSKPEAQGNKTDSKSDENQSKTEEKESKTDEQADQPKNS